MSRILPFLAGLLVISSPLAAQADAPPEHIGSFNVYRSKDPITDSDRSRAVVVAERGATLVPAVLGWECRGPDDVWLYLRNVPYGPGDRRITVTWRFDQDAPQTGEWSVNDHGVVSFEGDDDTFADFIDDFRQSQTLAVRSTSAAGEQATFLFHLAGSDAALNHIPCMAKQNAATPPAPPAPSARP
jgi:hypothetical protein